MLVYLCSVTEALQLPIVLQRHRLSSSARLHRGYLVQRGDVVQQPQSQMRELTTDGAGSDIRKRTSRGIARAMTNDAVEGTGADSLWNIPNILTMARLVAIPMLIVVFYSNYVSGKWVGLTEESLSENIF